MSAAERPDRDDREPKKDPRKPLSQRELFELYLHDPAVRPYLFGALGALAMIFLVLFLNGSDIGGAVVVLWGLAGLLLRWIAAPAFLLICLLYFLLFPFAVPDPDSLYNNPLEVRDTHFRVQDVVLALAVLVYLRCQFRLFGVVHVSMPFENLLRRKGEHPTRRPTAHIGANEIGWLIGVSAGLVLVGQLAWWFVNALDFVPVDEGVPFRWADTGAISRYRRGGREAGEFSPGSSRFFAVLGLLFFGFLLVRLVFGYWRLRTTSAAEGAMVMTDTSWAESHRERVRVEKWRIWGRQTAEEDARKAVREERERRRKEEQARERTEARERDRGREDDDDRPRRRR